MSLNIVITFSELFMGLCIGIGAGCIFPVGCWFGLWFWFVCLSVGSNIESCDWFKISGDSVVDLWLLLDWFYWDSRNFCSC